MKKFLIVVAIIMTMGVLIKKENSDIVIIPDNSLRFRVIANSDSIHDYEVKTQVKESVELALTELLKDATTIDESKSIITSEIAQIKEVISKILTPLGIEYKLNLGQNHFPEKIFKGVIYPDGVYESLVITIGEGKGDNWWCVLFPPLCLLEDNNTTSDVEYQLFVSRIINYFK